MKQARTAPNVSAKEREIIDQYKLLGEKESVDNLEGLLAHIDFQLDDKQRIVTHYKTILEDIERREKAADGVLRTSASPRDQREMKEMLANLAEERHEVERRKLGVDNFITEYEMRRKHFPVERINEARRVAEAKARARYTRLSDAYDGNLGSLR